MNLNILLDPLAVGALVVVAMLFPWAGAWQYRRRIRSPNRSMQRTALHAAAHAERQAQRR